MFGSNFQLPPFLLLPGTGVTSLPSRLLLKSCLDQSTGPWPSHRHPHRSGQRRPAVFYNHDRIFVSTSNDQHQNCDKKFVPASTNLLRTLITLTNNIHLSPRWWVSLTSRSSCESQSSSTCFSTHFSKNQRSMARSWMTPPIDQSRKVTTYGSHRVSFTNLSSVMLCP